MALMRKALLRLIQVQQEFHFVEEILDEAW